MSDRKVIKPSMRRHLPILPGTGRMGIGDHLQIQLLTIIPSLRCWFISRWTTCIFSAWTIPWFCVGLWRSIRGNLLAKQALFI